MKRIIFSAVVAIISSSAFAQNNSVFPSGGGGGGTPGGSDTQIQYNNSSAFGGLASFTVTGAGTATETLKYLNPFASTGVTDFVIQGGVKQNNVPFPCSFRVLLLGGSNGLCFNDSQGLYINGPLKFGLDANSDPVQQILKNSSGAIDFLSGPTPNDNTGHSAFNVEITGNYVISSGTGAYMWLGDDTNALGFAPTSGTGVFNGLWTNWVVNQTGGASGITRGVYVNNTITAAADYRGVEVSDVGTTMTALKTGNGKVIFGGLVTDATKTDATVCEDTTTHQLYFGSGTLGICLGTSSARFKPYMAPIAEGLPQIMALQPIRYKLDAEHGDPDKVLYGFTAEQGGSVLPELMGRDADGRPNTFDYLGVVPVLVKALQEQQNEIAYLKKHLDAVTGR
jgi:hypothetical protein